MIKEDYVSFETAKLLKEKGFDEGCRTRYGSAGSFSYEKYEIEASECEMYNAILAPTLQMAMKWLREVHNIYIWVQPNSCKEGLHDAHVKEHWWKNTWAGVGYKSYEEAVEVAIKYTLENLI